MEDMLLYCFLTLDEFSIWVCGALFAIFCIWMLVKKLLKKKKESEHSQLIKEAAEELPKNALLGAGMTKQAETEMIQDNILKLLRHLKLKKESNGGSNSNDMMEHGENREFGWQDEVKMPANAVENMMRGLKIRFIAESRERVVIVYRKAKEQ